MPYIYSVLSELILTVLNHPNIWPESTENVPNISRSCAGDTGNVFSIFGVHTTVATLSHPSIWPESTRGVRSIS